MSSLETKERHSKRIKRNLHAKRLRQDREYLPKIVENKKKKNTRTRMSPRDVERYIDD